MSEPKIIAVVGATGAQGGGLVRAIQSDPSGGFRARALTRDVNSEKAKALAALGAEVVAADVDDAASLERACHQLLTSTDERRTWSTRGRERAAPFTWERAARETLAVYQGLPG